MKTATLAVATAGALLVLSACSGAQTAGSPVLPASNASQTAGAAATFTAPQLVQLTSFHEYNIPTKISQPYDITLGPDGNFWFTEQNGNKIGRITSNGSITEFRAPDSASMPTGIAAGSDGNLWFSENQYGYLVRATTAGTMKRFHVAGDNAEPNELT